MEHFKTVTTLLDTSYTLGEKLTHKQVVTDISISYNDEPLTVDVWTTPEDSEDEKLTVVIPYHAVELLVKL